MKIKINRKELLNGISKAKIAKNGKHHLAILSSALLIAKDNSLEILATDLETVFHGTYPAKVINPGSIVASIDILSNFIRKSNSQEISIIEKELRWINISDGSASLNFACPSIDDFPLLEEAKEAPRLSIASSDFKEMIDVTVILHPHLDERIYILGIYFQIIENNLRAVSTNGDCLALIDKEINITNSHESETNINRILIPKKGLEKLNKILLKNSKQKAFNSNLGMIENFKDDVLLGADQNYFIARKQNESVLIRLLEGEFPDYEDVIKESGNNIIINRKKLLEIMKKMAAMQDASYIGATVNIRPKNMKIAFINPNIGEMIEEIEIEYEGNPIESSFNPKFFIDFLQIMKSNKIKLDFKEACSPCIITGNQDKGFIGIIMPRKDD